MKHKRKRKLGRLKTTVSNKHIDSFKKHLKIISKLDDWALVVLYKRSHTSLEMYDSWLYVFKPLVQNTIT